MRNVSIELLPAGARTAYERLRDELRGVLGTDLVALWGHGAATFRDRPERLGDVDTHGVLASALDPERAAAIDQIHDSIATDLDIEWDSWYILESEARDSRPPRHALREGLIDHAWALHRAHWLKGQYVAIHGCMPSDLVHPPSWGEIQDALRHELVFIERLREEGREDPGEVAFMVWNACRIIYSLETQVVVVSKNAAAHWALDHLPRSWHAAIRAAGRVYNGKAAASDTSLLKSAITPIIASIRGRI